MVSRQGNSRRAREARSESVSSYIGKGIVTPGQGGGVASLPVSLPVAPIFFASTAKLAGWNGASMKVSSNTAATTGTDVGFGADNRIDLAAVETIGGGQNGGAFAVSLLDQSGSGNNTQKNSSWLAPTMRRQALTAGVALPLIFGSNSSLAFPSTLSVDQANHSVFIVLNPVVSRMFDTWTNLGGALPFGPVTQDSANTDALRITAAGNVTRGAPRPIRAQTSVLGYSSGPTDVKFSVDGQVETASGGALPSATLTGGTFSNNAGYHEIMAIVVFPRALSAAEMQAVSAALEAIAAPVRGQTKGVIMIGDSLTAGQGAIGYVAGFGSYRNEPRQLHELIAANQNVAMFNFGTSSIPASAIDQRKANAFPSLLAAYPGITRWVARVHIGINDLRSLGSKTAQQIYDNIVSICTYLRSLGIKVIVTTINIQAIDANYTSASETARGVINGLIRANWQNFADDFADYDAIPELADPTNQTYFTSDFLHQRPPAYSLKAALSAPKVNALLAA